MKVLQTNYEVRSEPKAGLDRKDTCLRHKDRTNKITSRGSSLRHLLCCTSNQEREPVSILERGTTVKMGVECDDSLVYETFGIRICTKELASEDGTCACSHTVQKVIKNGPADKMGIRKGDEVILINGLHFAPYLSHSELLELFRDIKIDGTTTLALVLNRRSRSLGIFSSVLWVDTSAVLAPDKLSTGKQPTVINEQIHRIKDAVYNSKSENLYQISGAQKFLEICNNAVSAGVMTGTDSDKNKAILRTTRISRTKGDITSFTYESTLSDTSKKQFINIVGAEIVLQDTSAWFNMKMNGDDIHFKMENRYLAYDETDVCASDSVYWFQELPAKAMLFHIEAFESRLLTAAETVPLGVDADSCTCTYDVAEDKVTQPSDMSTDCCRDLRRNDSVHEPVAGPERGSVHFAEVYVRSDGQDKEEDKREGEQHTRNVPEQSDTDTGAHNTDKETEQGIVTTYREEFNRGDQNTDNVHVNDSSGQSMLASDKRDGQSSRKKQPKHKRSDSSDSDSSSSKSLLSRADSRSDSENGAGNEVRQTSDERFVQSDSGSNRCKDFGISIKQKRQRLIQMKGQDPFECGLSTETLQYTLRKDGSLSSGYKSDNSGASFIGYNGVPLAEPEDSEQL